jgi:HlyD family secretion protein
MGTAPQMTADTVVRVPYARTGLPRRLSRRWWLVTAVVVGLGLVGSVLAIRASDRWRGLFGAASADPTVYSVRPVDLSITLSEDGELKPKHSIEVKCELEGQSTILRVVEESTKVKKGDLLVELASDAIKERLESEQMELRKIESALEAARQDLSLTRNENGSKIKKGEVALELADLELQRYLKGDFERALLTADINIKQTELDIQRKQDELQKNQDLWQKGFVTQSKLDQLKFELEKAEMTLEQNVLAKSILLEYEKPKNVKQKETDAEQAQQELEREKQRAASRENAAIAKVQEQEALLAVRTPRVTRLREQYEKCKIYAPIDGIVRYPADEADFHRGSNRIAAGEKAYEGQTLVVLPDASQMIVTTRIHEADRHKIHEGLLCLVKVPAVPGSSFSGKISRIAQFADTTNRWLNPELKEHATEILLDETNAPLSPGDSAEIKILIEEVTNALAIPVQCAFSRGPKSYVFVRNGGKTEYREVKLGRASTSMVEIVQGLSAGDTILMHVGEDLMALLPAAGGVQTAMQQLPPFPGGSPSGARARPEAGEHDPTKGGSPPPTSQAAMTQPALPQSGGPQEAAALPVTTQPAVNTVD